MGGEKCGARQVAALRGWCYGLGLRGGMWWGGGVLDLGDPEDFGASGAAAAVGLVDADGIEWDVG